MIRASDLHVISVISNPVRYESRVRLFQNFLAEMGNSGATHWVVEATFGEREPSIAADETFPRLIRVRCDEEVWLKENLINIAAARLPADAKYIMWLDGDVGFGNANWATEVVEALQHYDVVQPFSHVVDYGPKGEILQTHKGFGYCYVEGENKLGGWKYGGPYWHPGYAFAWRRSAWDAVGGMMDLAICGAADYHMACALIGQADFSFPGNIHPNYKHMIMQWQDRAEHAINRNLGYVPGTIHHEFHGHKGDRRYIERWDILTESQFDPYTDVHKDSLGLLRLSTPHNARRRRLRDQMRRYFRQRNEDAR